MLERFENYLDTAIQRGEVASRAGIPAARRLMDAAGALRSGALRLQASDAAVAGGLAFLIAELEKRDPTVHEPLTSVTWMRDIPVDSGGGWVEFSSNYFADYQISGGNGYGIQAGESTAIPVAQANITKDIYRVFNWFNEARVTFVDMQKSQNIGRSLDNLYDNCLRLNWNKSLDQQTYIGPIASAGSTPSYPGLVNNSNVTASAVATVSAATTWAAKLALGTQAGIQAIMNDVNTAVLATWAASNYDVTGMANQILIPPAQFTLIANALVSTAGTVSILTYILANNIAKTQGVNLKIFPSRWCSGAGQSATDRMVAYVADKKKIYMDIPVPIQRVMTVPTVTGGGAYETLYGGQIGVVKPMYYQPIAYYDGI
jgi:hypothetical protein